MKGDFSRNELLIQLIFDDEVPLLESSSNICDQTVVEHEKNDAIVPTTAPRLSKEASAAQLTMSSSSPSKDHASDLRKRARQGEKRSFRFS